MRAGRKPQRQTEQLHYQAFGAAIRRLIYGLCLVKDWEVSKSEEHIGVKVGYSTEAVKKWKRGERRPTALEVFASLAQLAKNDAHLDRSWGNDLFRSAGYSNQLVKQAVDQVWGGEIMRRVANNLPWRPPGALVGRRESLSQIFDVLALPSLIGVVIKGLSGTGKTRLALEVAFQILDASSERMPEVNVPGFDAIVFIPMDSIAWIELTHSVIPANPSLIDYVLDTIARTLDYGSHTKLQLQDKVWAVDRLLRNQRTLLILDNFENCADHTVLTWLNRLPEPCRVVIATRYLPPDLREHFAPIHLEGLTEEEAAVFIGHCVEKLHMPGLTGNTSILGPLVEITGGNPKAIEMALGYINFQHRPVVEVLSDLKSARSDLFANLFASIWRVLGDATAEKNVLMAATLFLTSVEKSALALVADVESDELERAIEHLCGLSLLNIERNGLDGSLRITLHPLVRAYAHARLEEDPAYAANMRLRWIQWCVGVSSKVGYCWNQNELLYLLDLDWETVKTVIDWCIRSNLLADALTIVNGCSYYSYVRGYWQLGISLIGADLAQRLGDHVTEARFLSYYVQMLGRRGETNGAEEHFERLKRLEQSVILPKEIRHSVYYAYGLFLRGKADYDGAIAVLESLVGDPPDLRELQVVRLSLGQCYRAMGRFAEAEACFHSSLCDSRVIGHQRAQLIAEIELISIALDRAQLAGVTSEIEDIERRIMILDQIAHTRQDRENETNIELLRYRLYCLLNDSTLAIGALQRRIAGLERLGKPRELAEAQGTLRQLLDDSTA